MTAQEIRQKYLDFFSSRDHEVIPRALLVPQNDPTTLFTGSGMQPLITYLLGAKHSAGKKLVNSQTCLRAQDIDEVGDNRHTTFFEMLGNWSLGDYFKKEQIPWIFEFLTEVIGLDPNRIFVTCCSGFPQYKVPKDTESAEIWTQLFKSKGIDAKQVEIGSEENGYKLGDQNGRIFFYDEKNWWSRNGAPQNVKLGEPCGPDTEMFYLFDSVKHDPKWGEKCHVNCDCGRYIELGNSVFMEYMRTEEGFLKLPAKNVDYGGGLERIAAAAIDSPDVFKISLLWPIIESLEKMSGKSYDQYQTNMRVIADHLRAATFLAIDAVVPSNKEQGYVMRRLMRRAIRFAFDLGIEQSLCQKVAPVIIELYKDDFPEVESKIDQVIELLSKEEKIFRQTLRNGVKELQKMVKQGELGGEQIFALYDTYGFPVELSVEEAYSLGFDVSDKWRVEFDAKMTQQKERSKTATKGTFKGGLGGQTDQHKKYHTATHLMYQALRDVLGDHVIQRGSNITQDRLRFDFSHDEKVTAEQIEKVENIVNDQISQDLKVSFREYPTKVAREEKNALGQFGDRYGETVKVYSMQAEGADKPFSFEICGGPHVDHTAQLTESLDGISKKFKIIKEESSSAGIRRIKAVLI